MNQSIDPDSDSANGVAVAVWVFANLLCYTANENSWLSRLLRVPPLLCVSNRIKFADPQPETFWAFDVLDPRDLAKSYWIGSRGLLLLRLCIVVYFVDILTTAGLTAHGFEGAHWMVYFTNWSLCLILLSTALGAAVSLRYLIWSYHNKNTVVHGRPGLTPQHRLADCPSTCFGRNPAATTDELEEGLILPLESARLSTTDDAEPEIQLQHPLQAPAQATASNSRADSSIQPVRSQSSQPQSGKAMFAKANGHARTPSDLESLAPAELRYAPQLTQWSLLDMLHCLALQTAAVTSTLVLVFYWAFSTGPNQKPLPDDYLQHAANAPIILLDVFFSKVPFVSYHLQVMILYGCVYQLFMWAYYGVSNAWVYDVLTWHVDKFLAVYILLPIVYVLLFYTWFVVVMARNRLGEKCGNHVLCPTCYQRHSHQAAVQAQKSEPPVLSPKHLKKQSSGVGWHASGSSSLSPLNVIAGDTRYSGQQILTSGRTVLSPVGASTDSLVMELSRRGSAPR